MANVLEGLWQVETAYNDVLDLAWPDAGITPFRSEKNSNWEGAYRVPAVARWPGRIQPGQVSTEMMSHLDWMPTMVAAAGDPELKQKLLEGTRIGKGKSSQVFE